MALAAEPVGEEALCAMERSVISPAERGEMGGESLDPMADPESKDNNGDQSMPGN